MNSLSLCLCSPFGWNLPAIRNKKKQNLNRKTKQNGIKFYFKKEIIIHNHNTSRMCSTHTQQNISQMMGKCYSCSTVTVLLAACSDVILFCVRLYHFPKKTQHFQLVVLIFIAVDDATEADNITQFLICVWTLPTIKIVSHFQHHHHHCCHPYTHSYRIPGAIVNNFSSNLQSLNCY